VALDNLEGNDDSDLVEGLLARHDAAVRLFIQRYKPLFHHCINHFETDAGAREDLFQDLSWYALERLSQGSFDPEKGSFGTWLYRVSWCRCVDLKRQQSARRKLRVAIAEDELPDRADPTPSPHDVLGEAEVGGLVRLAMASLDPEDQSLLELRFAQERILPDVAAELGLSVEQTKYRLKRASTNLRRALLSHLPRQEAVE
jgi:RNA polymerase sigma-70 factor (ECF subfamily)